MLELPELQNKLKEFVIGQDEAISVISTTIYKYLIKLHARDFGYYFTGGTSLLLLGPSGSGKTFLTKKTAELTNIPFIEINSKSICQEGWSGKSFKDLFEEELKAKEQHSSLMTTGGIVFIDEFDKILSYNSSTNGDVNYHIQSTLLKYIEGFDWLISANRRVNTNNFLFIFAGAFVDLDIKEEIKIGFLKDSEKPNLTAALVKYGMLPEIAGRIQEYSFLKELTDEFFIDILNSKEFVLTYWKNILDKLDIKFTVSYTELIKAAQKKELGVRGLIQEVERIVTESINLNKDKVNLDKFSPLYTKQLKNQGL